MSRAWTVVLCKHTIRKIADSTGRVWTPCPLVALCSLYFVRGNRRSS